MTQSPIPSAAMPLEARWGEGSLYNSVYLHAPFEATPEMVLRPEWYAHVASRIVAGDQLNVRHEAGLFHMTLLVRRVNAAGAAVEAVVLQDWREPSPVLESSGDLKVSWRADSGWLLLNTKTGEIDKSGYQSRTEAAWALKARAEAARADKGAKAA